MDLVTGCTTSYVAGGSEFAPPIFEAAKPLFRNDLGRIGGIGIKIQPDHRYVNLYYWPLGDNYLVRYPVGHPLPDAQHAYPQSPDRF